MPNVIQYNPEHDPASGDIITGMPIQIYHAHENSISNSGLSLIARSPAHYRYGPPRTPSRAQVIGQALHSCLLEPELFEREYINAGTPNRTASEYKQAVNQIGDPSRVLTQPEHDNIRMAVESVWAQSGPRALLESDDHRELSVFATDPETGVMVRIRPDIIAGGGVLIDLKKTQDARAPAFERAIMNYRYHVQAALYMDAWRWASGDSTLSWQFLAVEEQPPHAAKIYELDDTALAEGRKLYREALDQYAHCLERDEWPAYPCDEPELIGLPSWRVAQIEDEMEVNIDE